MESTRLQKLLEFYKNEPQDAFIKYALATEYLSLNDFEKALYFYENLIEEHASYVGTYYHLGKLYENLGRKNDAIRIYEQGINIAREARNMHALSELQGVYREALGMDDDDY